MQYEIFRSTAHIMCGCGQYFAVSLDEKTKQWNIECTKDNSMKITKIEVVDGEIRAINND